MALEIVRPDALKRLMSSINGNTVRVSSLELARMKLNWPKNSERPPRSHLYVAYKELDSMIKNPPDGFEVREAPGEFFSIYIRREKSHVTD